MREAGLFLTVLYHFVCVGSKQPMSIQAWVEQVTCRRLSLLQDCRGVGCGV